jgi:hypothetical protein
MQKPARLRAIFSELRRAAGPEAPAGDLIRLAHLILRAYSTDIDELDGFGRPVDNRAFFALPLDFALRDGGWRVLCFEAKRGFQIDDMDPADLAILKVHIQRFLGPQWQQQLQEA